MKLENCWSTLQCNVDKVVTGPLDNNVYFVQCRSSGASIMIDAPGGAPELLLSICAEHNIDTVLITHGHADHIGAIEHLRADGLRVGIGSADVVMTQGIDFEIDDNNVFEVGELRLEAMSTPGHTPGSTCFSIAGQPVVFTGDTLFPGGPGATRWPYSSFDAILDSIEQRLFTLSDSTTVFAGHGDSTTIAAERPQLTTWRTWS